MREKVKLINVTKIFGRHIKPAIKLYNEGVDKSTIVDRTGSSVAVYNANVSIFEGEIFVIMGLSGSGKSTLVRLINRLIEPTSGVILIDNVDITKLNKAKLQELRRTKMSMVFQNFGLFPHKTILANTEYGLEVRNIMKKQRRELAEEALKNAGLLSYKDQYPSQLSGGMQQRVGLARALANNPEILLMDEAFSALDPLIRREMQDELLRLQQNMRKTVIFITHDLDEALRIGDRIAILKDGVVVQVGTGEEILMNPANSYVEAFVENVDRSKVLSAENIMTYVDRPLNINHDGVNVALNRMYKEKKSHILLTDNTGEVLGYVSARETAALMRREGRAAKFDSILHMDVTRISPDTPVSEIYNLMEESVGPIAVMRDDKLIGTIRESDIISMLSTRNGVSNYE